MAVPSQQNIILIMADALRADRISAAGYRRDGEKTTPNIDELAEDGVLYPNAYSPGPWTADAQSAVLTGEYASNIGFPATGTPLPKTIKTIGEYFTNEGYETRAYNMSAHIRDDLGFAKGFDYWEDVWERDRIEPDPRYMESMLWNLIHGSDQRARYMTREINRWIGRRDDEDPFFLFWNPTNPHNKYRAPRGFRDLERDIEPEMDEESIEKVAGWGHCREYVTGELELGEDEMDVVESRYDAEVSYLDHRIGKLINHLKNEGVYEDTTIVLTSDHGENLGEKGLLYHNYALNEALIRVPLIIKGEGFEQTDSPVSTIDLLNSLYIGATGEEATGLSSEPSLLKGTERRDTVIAERRSSGDIPYLKERSDMLPEDYTWYTAGKKAAIRSTQKFVMVQGEREDLLDISNGEAVDATADAAEEMKSVVKESTGGYGEEQQDEIDEEKIKQQLEKLGYR